MNKATRDFPKSVDAVVIGGGFAGVCALHKLQEMGLTVRGF